MKTVEWASTSGPSPNELEFLVKVAAFELSSVNDRGTTIAKATLYFEPLSRSMYRCVERGSSREWFVSDSLG